MQYSRVRIALALGGVVWIVGTGCADNSGGFELTNNEIEVVLKEYLEEVPFEAWKKTVRDELFEQNSAPSPTEFVGCEDPATSNVGFVGAMVAPGTELFTVTITYTGCEVTTAVGEPFTSGDLVFDAPTDSGDGTIAGTLTVDPGNDLIDSAYPGPCTVMGDWTIDMMSHSVNLSIECGGEIVEFTDNSVEL